MILLAVVNSGLIALERGLVNPLQALAFVFRNACTRHQEPACGELCLGIATVGCQLIPEHTFFEVLLHAVAVPSGCADVLLAEDMPLESGLTIPEECLVPLL